MKKRYFISNHFSSSQTATSSCDADLHEVLREKAQHTQKYVSIFPARLRAKIRTGGRSITKPGLLRYLFLIFCLCWQTMAQAANLIEVYKQAQLSDPTFQQAIAQRLSTKEGLP